MGNIVVFGAGGRAGRRVVSEARERGHDVTAVVRRVDGAGEVVGDVTDPASVARVVAGADVVINAAARMDVPAAEFFPAAARALVAGMAEAGVRRLVQIGMGTALLTDDGVAVYDTPGFPAEYRDFSLGHAAGIDVLRDSELEWVVLAPPPELLDNSGPRTGRYRLGGVQVLPASGQLLPYADLAVALVDEAETPKHHRELVAVAPFVG